MNKLVNVVWMNVRINILIIWTFWPDEHSELKNILSSGTFWTQEHSDECSDYDRSIWFASDDIKGFSLRPLVICNQSLLGFFMINNFSLRKLNLSSTRDFVKKSASWFSVSTKLNAIFFSWSWSLMKWCFISICLDLECWIGFLERLIALALSQKKYEYLCTLVSNFATDFLPTKFESNS